MEKIKITLTGSLIGTSPKVELDDSLAANSWPATST